MAAPPVAPAVVVVPSNFTAFAPLVILVLVICGGFWLMFGEPFLRYRIVGTWGTATVPHVNLTIFRDGRYELGPTDPRYGAIRKGRWQLHGTELELVGPESTQRHSIRLSSGRSIRAHTLWLGHVRYEVRRDRP
ncbi:MAG: hypothetical protein EXS32_17500 [Opitutus sp.]|nr:hypothetical protein [Opitutus sp.]